MNKSEEVSDAVLAAFVDGELAPSEYEHVLRAMEADPEVRDRIYALRRAGDLMQLGYGEARARTAKTARRHARKPGPDFRTLAWATPLLVLLVLLAGITGFQSGRYVSTQAVLQASNEKQTAPHRVVLHISKADPEQFSAALAYTREFVATNHKNSQITVVANSGGLKFLREDMSTFKEQITSLLDKHNNVHFVACANSIRALRKTGVNPEFIKNVDTSRPAFDQIVSRLADGWSYVKAETLPSI